LRVHYTGLSENNVSLLPWTVTQESTLLEMVLPKGIYLSRARNLADPRWLLLRVTDRNRQGQRKVKTIIPSAQ